MRVLATLALIALSVGCSRAAPAIRRDPAPTAPLPASASASASARPPEDQALPVGALSNKVRVADGKIVIERDGQIIFSTHGPYDDTPAVSPDHRVLAFVRANPEVQVSYYYADKTDRPDLWIVREGESPALLLAGGAREKPELYLEAMYSLEFLSDSKTILFAAPVAITSAGVFATDLAGHLTLISDGRLIGEVIRGRFKGHLFVEQRRLDWMNPFDSPKYRGRIERYAIMSRDGREIADLGDNAAKAFAVTH